MREWMKGIPERLQEHQVLKHHRYLYQQNFWILMESIIFLPDFFKLKDKFDFNRKKLTKLWMTMS